MGSGAHHLRESLNHYPHICCVHTNKVYTHPKDLDNLKSMDRYAKIYLDTIEFNYSFASKAFYDCCDFIYPIRNPKQSLGEMVSEGYSRESAMNYYLFRLRRMYEMAYHTPGSLFLTYEDLEKGSELIQNFLKLKTPPKVRLKEVALENWVPERGYGKYLSMFKRLDLKMVQ